jgi:hypothetical protein
MPAWALQDVFFYSFLGYSLYHLVQPNIHEIEKYYSLFVNE